jgi:hypothetical protein
MNIMIMGLLFEIGTKTYWRLYVLDLITFVTASFKHLISLPYTYTTNCIPSIISLHLFIFIFNLGVELVKVCSLVLLYNSIFYSI